MTAEKGVNKRMSLLPLAARQLPLSNVLLKIFVNGFYRVHAGLFLFGFLVIFGAVEPAELVNYHKALMLAFVSNITMLLVVFAMWLLYSVKTWHYIAGQIHTPAQQFLIYSSTSFPKLRQWFAWCLVQLYVLLPVVAYGVMAVVVGFSNHYYLLPVGVLTYLLALIGIGAFIYTWLVNHPAGGNNQSWLLTWGHHLRKPLYSLFIYHVANRLKGRFIVTKLLSYFIVNGVFWLFADVSNDTRVAGIAVLAIATAHTALVYENHRFEDSYLGFMRNLPYSRVKLFSNYVLTYLLLLLPELIWLLSRFHLLLAIGLIWLCVSMVLLFHSLLYWLGASMDKYLQWVMGLFIVMFWIMLYRQLWPLIVLNAGVAFGLFYKNYYRTFAIEPDK